MLCLLFFACQSTTYDTSEYNFGKKTTTSEPSQPSSEPEAPIEPSQEPSPDPSSYASIEYIFTEYACTGCHGTSGGFSLSYTVMLNERSSITNEFYIVPGNPDGSYLYKKITDAPGISGQPMPIGGSGGMPTEDREIIRSWIELGANP